MKSLYVSSHISSLHSVCSSKCLMKLRLSFGQGQAQHASKDKYLSFYYDALALHWDHCVDSTWCEKELVWNHCRSSWDDYSEYPNDEEMVRKYEMSLNHLLRIEATNRAMLLKSSGLSMKSCHPEPRGIFQFTNWGYNTWVIHLFWKEDTFHCQVCCPWDTFPCFWLKTSRKM